MLKVLLVALVLLMGEGFYAHAQYPCVEQARLVADLKKGGMEVTVVENRGVVERYMADANTEPPVVAPSDTMIAAVGTSAVGVYIVREGKVCLNDFFLMHPVAHRAILLKAQGPVI